MQGIDSFIFTNDIKKKYRDNICSLILDSYKKLIKSGKKYSKKSIKMKLESRGLKSRHLPLEDFLTFDFVNNYLIPDRSFYGLEYIYITPQTSETSENIETGKVDIKFSELSSKTYIIIECKRLDESKTSNYVKEGIKRFTAKQYYPEIEQKFAIMIGYLESSSRIKIQQKVNNYLKVQKDINTLLPLTQGDPHLIERLNSTHSVKNMYDIDIVHFWLDYTSLIV